MRFRSVLSGRTTLLIAATYVVYLGSASDLDLYIHPRYIVFTLVMAVIALGLITANAYFGDHAHDQHSRRTAVLPLLALLALAIALPARTLTSATVTQRATDAGSIVTTAEAKPISSLFAGSSRGLDLSDWSRLLATNEDPTYYLNKPAKISGFVYDAQLGSDTVWLARFVLTCCAVDAQPIGVPVQLTDWPNQYEEDEWVEVEGEFKPAPTAQGEQLVLIPDNVRQINQPSSPYAN